MLSKTIEQVLYASKSKVLGLLLPGAYQAKEAAKYAYNPADYKKHRAKYALLGAVTPGTATYIKAKAEQMHREGKSQEEIRRFINNHSNIKRLGTGIGEIVAASATSGLTSGVTEGVAYIKGAYDKYKRNRAYRTPSKLKLFNRWKSRS